MRGEPHLQTSRHNRNILKTIAVQINVEQNSVVQRTCFEAAEGCDISSHKRGRETECESAVAGRGPLLFRMM